VFCYQVMPFGLKKCRSNLPMNDAKLPWEPDRTQHPSLYR
jgi:hypothetical protein